MDREDLPELEAYSSLDFQLKLLNNTVQTIWEQQIQFQVPQSRLVVAKCHEDIQDFHLCPFLQIFNGLFY